VAVVELPERRGIVARGDQKLGIGSRAGHGTTAL
jgi:hypothetical protein